MFLFKDNTIAEIRYDDYIVPECTAVNVGMLFDLDGVLVDSETIYTEFWDMIDKMYPTGIPDFARVIKGNTLGRILDTYFPRDIHGEILRCLRRQEEEMVFSLFDGVAEALARLRASGCGCAVVTSSNCRKMRKLFGAIPVMTDLVDVVLTEEDFSASKPDPDGYLKAARALGCDISCCCVFEDSFSGLEAGRRAGAYVVGIATTNPRDSLVGKCDVIMDRVADFDIRDVEFPLRR